MLNGGGEHVKAVPARHPLLGLVVAQTLGAFNDNAWKQVVALLAIAAVASETAAQENVALAQVVLMVPFVLFSLPAGVLADRLSKRTVIVAMKGLELAVMVAGTAVLWAYPAGGTPALAVLAMLGVQATLFSPAKYGILPELLSHERLSAGNGLLEMASNLAIIAGTVAGGVILHRTGGQPWVAGLLLAALSVVGLLAALQVPRVPPARAEGGLAVTVKLAWSAVSTDRILRLAVIGQIVVWSIATLVPPPVLGYAKKTLGLDTSLTGLPLAALGIGIGLGCVAAGKLSASKVEYGLLPLGALGLTLMTLLFGAWGPGLIGTLFLMALIGVFTGLLFVPLNALVQWRAPEDRRGAVIALTNVLVCAGMLAGSLLAWGAAELGISARGTFLAASAGLAVGTAWAFQLVPDAFLRFVLVLLAHSLYRLSVVGRAHVPAESSALLTPNHVSFADGLFVIAAIDRPIRFVVYAEYFRWPLVGRFLRAMRAIPISAEGGPKVILHAFREAGQALDNGELVCLFPEGQITRTGTTLPFQRGIERIAKGRTAPIIPVHIDRATASIFSPMSTRRLPERIPLPVTVSFGDPLPTDTPLYQIRRSIAALDREAWNYRKADRRPLHHEFIRRARRHPFRLALADVLQPKLTFISALASAVALARALRTKWAGQANVGVMLPAGVAGAVTNLAAALSGKAVVNLNFTAGPAAIDSAVAQAQLRTVVTSRVFLERGKVEPPARVELIYVEDLRGAIGRPGRLAAMAMACLAPVRLLERYAGAAQPVSVDDTAAIIFSSGSTGDPKGVVLSHFNIDSNVVASGQVFRTRPDDRVLDVLPLFHSFGYLTLWLALNHGLGLVCHLNPLEAGAVGALVQRYRATILLATPTFLRLYLRRCTPAQFGSLRLVIAGAEKMPEALGREFADTFGIELREGYGLTECAPVVAVNTLDYRAPGFYQPGSRRGSVGQPLPGVTVRVADLDTGETAAPDSPGMVLVKGPNIMRGYLGRDDLTAASMQDGWYVTGDIGQLDEDGFLTITGRLSRFSKLGGEMVPHGRVEEALHEAIGATEPVFAVTAINDAGKNGTGERLVVLHTVEDEKAQEARDKLSSLGLPNLFIPRRDSFVKVQELPMLGSGKLDLRAVKKLAEEKLAEPAQGGPSPR